MIPRDPFNRLEMYRVKGIDIFFLLFSQWNHLTSLIHESMCSGYRYIDIDAFVKYLRFYSYQHIILEI